MAMEGDSDCIHGVNLEYSHCFVCEEEAKGKSTVITIEQTKSESKLGNYISQILAAMFMVALARFLGCNKDTQFLTMTIVIWSWN